MNLSSDVIYNCFRRLLEEHFSKPDEKEIHVHEIVQCLRKSYFERKYGNEKLTHLSDTKCVILGLGIAVHKAIESILSDWLKARHEEKLAKEYNINGLSVKLVGTVDILVSNIPIELKTVNKIPDKPYPHHYYQIQMYIELLNTTYGYIVYICKKDGRIKVYRVHRDSSVISNMLERLAYYFTCLTTSSVPKPEESYLCNYCEWAFECGWDNDKQG